MKYKVKKYKSTRKYRCPFCRLTATRGDLAAHVEKEHEDMIPEGYNGTRVVYDYINKKNYGTCLICKQPVYEWDDNVARYKNICNRPECMEALKKKAQGNHFDDPEVQKKMLAARKISGSYKFRDGTVHSYVGTYELRCFEFMDSIGIQGKDIMSPGPTIYYEYKGETHPWILDWMYIPAMLCCDVKDGGSNPNNRPMIEYREKQLAKEAAIEKNGQYNYIRLTDNNFGQLLSALADIRYGTINHDPINHIYINESSSKNSNDMNGIFELLDKLNEFDYKFMSKSGKELKEDDPSISDDDFAKKYNLQSPSIFEKRKAGVCWDYTAYEAKWFKDHGIDFKAYYIGYKDIVNNEFDYSHTFIIFHMNGKSYYFESSWGALAGIWEANSDKDIIGFTMDKHAAQHKINKNDKNIKAYAYSYNALANNTFNMNMYEFIDWIESNGSKVTIPTSYKEPEKVRNNFTENEIFREEVNTTPPMLKDSKFIKGTLKDMQKITDTLTGNDEGKGNKLKEQKETIYRDIQYASKDHGGWVEMYSSKDSTKDCQIASIAIDVDPEARGTGLSDKLINGAKANMKKLGIDRIEWYCKRTNIGSYKLAKRCGFKEEPKLCNKEWYTLYYGKEVKLEVSGGMPSAHAHADYIIPRMMSGIEFDNRTEPAYYFGNTGSEYLVSFDPEMNPMFDEKQKKLIQLSSCSRIVCPGNKLTTFTEKQLREMGEQGLLEALIGHEFNGWRSLFTEGIVKVSEDIDNDFARTLVVNGLVQGVRQAFSEAFEVQQGIIDTKGSVTIHRDNDGFFATTPEDFFLTSNHYETIDELMDVVDLMNSMYDHKQLGKV